jgi:hypothetical protein
MREVDRVDELLDEPKRFGGGIRHVVARRLVAHADTSVTSLPVPMNDTHEPGASTRIRWRLQAPVAVARARLGARVGRSAVVVLGVAVSAALLVAILGGSLVTQDLTIRRSLRSLPPSARSFRVDAFGLPARAHYGRYDRAAKAALGTLTTQRPVRVTVFRTLSIATHPVRLAGVDGLARLTRLRAGRLPKSCTADRCEVLQIGREAPRVLDGGGIHLVRVGVATLVDPSYRTLFATGGTVTDQPVVLAAAGGDAFERLHAFDDFYRVYSWIAPIDARRIHPWQLDALFARESLAHERLLEAGAEFQLTAPDAALSEARAEGRTGAQRLVLVGGEISVLLLGFAAIAAMGFRRGLREELRRLAQRGATQGQIAIAAFAEVASLAVAGMVAGIAIGAVAVTVIARRADLPVGGVLSHGLLTPLRSASVVGLCVATVVTFVAVLSTGERASGRRVRLLDVAGLAALGAIALELARGSVGEAALASGRAAVMFSLLPGLICFVAAIVASRLLPPAMRLAERSTRRQPLALRLGLLALARAPSRTTLTVGFLVASLGLALFATTYRATLRAGARDEAAFAVPLDYTLTTGPRLVRPLDAAPVRSYERLAGGVHAYPVIRRTAEVAGPGASVLSPTVIGLPAEAIERMRWRSDFAELPPAEIARRLHAGAPAGLRGVPIPKALRSFRMDVEVRGVPLSFRLVGEDARQRTVAVPLGEPGRGMSRLTAEVPASLERILALELSIAPGEAVGLAHRGEAQAVVGAPRGSTTLGPLVARTADGGRDVVTNWAAWRADRGHVRAKLPPRLSYTFVDGTTLVLRPTQATDGRMLPVLVSPEIARAAPAGTLLLDVGGAQLRARIVGVASRFPTLGGRDGFVVADEAWLATALGAAVPGSATSDELWLSTPASEEAVVGRRLDGPPFAGLEVAARSSRERQLASDPLARAISMTLTAAAALAVLLACAGLWLAVAGDARDERNELFDLEAQGVPPQTLRHQLAVRTTALIAFGALGGLALGVVLSRVVVGLVRVSAVSQNPEPPLVVARVWPVVLVGVGALAVVTAVLATVIARRALRGDVPTRGSWSVE